MVATGVQVVGLNKVVRSLQKFGVEAADLKEVFSKIANTVATDAKQNVTSRTGTLAGSIRAGKSKNKAVVRAGSARVPYAGVIEYGGYNNITPHNYMQNAASANESKSIKMVEEGLEELIQKLDLN